MDNIERCKKAQELGLRVQYCRQGDNLWIGEKENGGAFLFFCDDEPDRYRVHPDDKKAFENFLALEAQKTQWREAAISYDIGSKLLAADNKSLQGQNDTLKRANEQLREHVMSVEEELRTLREQRTAQRENYEQRLANNEAERLSVLDANKRLAARIDELKAYLERAQLKAHNLESDNRILQRTIKELQTRPSADATTEDLISQLCRKIGPNVSITVVNRGV